MKPQLAHTLSNSDSLLADDGWWMEQKFDGDRLLLVYEDGKIPSAITRKGEPAVLPKSANLDMKSPIHHLHRGTTILDCELMEHGAVYVFDIPMIRGVNLCGLEYRRRRELLENLFESFHPAGFVLVDVFRTTDEKQEAFQGIRNNGDEGVIFKKLDSKYRFDYRSKGWIKHKFYKTCSAIVTELNRENKPESVTICVIDNGSYHEISGCKIPSRYQEELGITVGDVIEVRYLSLTPDNKVTQPIFIRKRRDIEPSEATLERLVNESK